MSILSKFHKNKDGAVTVETSLMILVLIVLTGGTIEAGYAYYQYNGAQTAARTGARIAATSDPVAISLNTMTGLSNGVEVGDPMPFYKLDCDGTNQNCSSGGYNSAAMSRILYGPDGDNTCGPTTRARRGMCDVFSEAKLGQVNVSYENSGLGKAGYQTDPAPLVSVTLKKVPLNFLFLDLVGFKDIATLPPVTATVMGEDLKNG